eukprot:GFUD01065022.1.p1 GENE.GFUD01065022.1~~GFUD01065022.1.p1  ORF type:complete len:274 (-),score=46.27 GFUD01065022.1:84-905(-)
MTYIKETNKSLLTRISGIIYIWCTLIVFSLSNPSYPNGIQINAYCLLFFFISGCVCICCPRNGNSVLVLSTLAMSINSALLVTANSCLLVRIGDCSGSSYSCNVLLFIEITKLICAIASSIFSLLPFYSSCRSIQDTSNPMEHEHDQIGQQLAGVHGAQGGVGDLPRYEDVVGIEDGRVMYRPSGYLDNEQMVSLAMQAGQSVTGMHNTEPGDEDLPKYEDVFGIEEGNEQITIQMGHTDLGVQNNEGGPGAWGLPRYEDVVVVDEGNSFTYI